MHPGRPGAIMVDRVDFDDFTKNYDQLLSQGTSFFTPNEKYFCQYKVDIVRNRVALPVNRVLEYGCGLGRNIPFLREAFRDSEVTGSDIAPASLEIARQGNPGIEFIQEEAGSRIVGKWDLIFVAGVFHHVPMDQRLSVAKTLFERLETGGSLFVFEHNPYNPVTRRIVSTCAYDEDAVLLKPFELLDLMRRAGFVVTKKAYCLFVPPRLTFLAGAEKFLGWLPLGGQYWTQLQHPDGGS